MVVQNLVLRPEREEDQKIVENITREAFWNHHGPGCNEHYLLHVLRGCDAFIPELDYIVEWQDDIVGNIVYTHAKIIGDSGKTYSVISFGPISVLPSHQGKGIGKALIEKTKIIARSLGYQAILIYGDPEYYKKVGFRGAEEYGIGTADNDYATPLLACELVEGALRGKAGRFLEDEAFDVSEEMASEFDKAFPVKAKLEGLPSQHRFLELVKMRKPRGTS